MLARNGCSRLLSQAYILKYNRVTNTVRNSPLSRGNTLPHKNESLKLHGGAFELLRRQHHQKHNISTGSVVSLGTSLQILWKKLFGKYLLATNTISSGILMVIGDLMAQEIEYQRCKSSERTKPRCDLKRVWRMFIVGCLQGPLHHYVYKWMDKVMPLVNMRNTMRKILLDQLIMSPLCIVLFFYPACFLEDKCVQETNLELRQKFGYIYLMDWLVWPPAQFVNFHYLDTKYRVIFVNVCTAMYNIFLSFMKHDFC